MCRRPGDAQELEPRLGADHRGLVADRKPYEAGCEAEVDPLSTGIQLNQSVEA
jgi:hypothetical protein